MTKEKLKYQDFPYCTVELGFIFMKAIPYNKSFSLIFLLFKFHDLIVNEIMGIESLFPYPSLFCIVFNR